MIYLLKNYLIIIMKVNPIRKNYQTSIQNNQNPKLIKKSQLKKTILISNTYNINENRIAGENINNEVKESTKKEKAYIKSKKDNKAEFLIKTIIKAFYLSIWKKKVNSMKYYSRSYNPRRLNFKKLINEISLVVKQKKFEYFNEIYQKMKRLPLPSNIKHDINFGKIRIVNKEVLAKKNVTEKISQNKENQAKKTNTKIRANNYEKKIPYIETKNEKNSKGNFSIITNVNNNKKTILQPKVNINNKYTKNQNYNYNNYNNYNNNAHINKNYNKSILHSKLNNNRAKKYMNSQNYNMFRGINSNNEIIPQVQEIYEDDEYIVEDNNDYIDEDNYYINDNNNYISDYGQNYLNDYDNNYEYEYNDNINLDNNYIDNYEIGYEDYNYNNEEGDYDNEVNEDEDDNNFNNYNNEDYYDDYIDDENNQYVDEEKDYYELPYTNSMPNIQKKNEVRYISNYRNNTLTNDYYLEPKVISNKAIDQANKNYNSTLNIKSNYYGKNIWENESNNNATLGFKYFSNSNRRKNNSFYISK